MSGYSGYNGNSVTLSEAKEPGLLAKNLKFLKGNHAEQKNHPLS
jgi:hypothetical protein